MDLPALKEALYRDKIPDDDTSGPKLPYLTVTYHSGVRGAAIGAGSGLIGCAAVAGVKSARGTLPGAISIGTYISRRVCGYMRGGTLLFGAIGTGLAIARLESVQPDGLEDRAFRLKFNETQNKIDRALALGAGGGLVLGALGATLQGGRVPRGASCGVPVGMLLSMAALGIKPDLPI